MTPMQDLGVRFDANRQALEERVGDHAQKVAALFDTHQIALDAALDHHQASMAGAAKQSAEDFDGRLSALADAADQSARIIDGRLADLADAASRNAGMIDERLTTRISEMNEALARKTAEADATLATRGVDLAASIAARVDDLRAVIDGKGSSLVAALGERGEDVSNQITGVGARAAQTIDQQMSSLVGLLTRRTDELIAAVNGSAADPVRILAALSGQVRAEVANSSEALRGAAEDAAQRSGAAIEALLKRATEQIELSGASLRGAVAQSAGAAEGAAQRSTEAIDALLRRVTDQIELSGVSLRDAVAASAETSVVALAGTGDRLRNELTQVIDNLGQTSAAIDHAVSSAGERLTAVQGGLAARVEEFQRALGGIASQVATLGRLTTTTQADATALAAQLAQHADSLSTTAEELAAQQHTLDLTLEHRQSSLQALIADLSGRSEAFNTVLTRFASSVEDSFTRAHARAQEIGAALASATQGASVAVAGQFETIRDTAARERDRTAETLQAAIEQTNAQLTGALDHAADRFRQSVAEVKDMAGQVQRELEATRQELRRGVLELPQETSETAEAMRRVVSDQIRALKELAELVTDSGAAYDVAEPVAIAAPAASAAAATVRYEQPAHRPAVRAVEAPSPRETAAAHVAEAIAIPVVEPLGSQKPVAQIAAPELAAPASDTRLWTVPHPTGPLPPVASSARSAQPPSDRGQAGWLSNLLAAASRDEPDAKGAQIGTQTLDALTQGIDGLIDNAAAVEMWDRWRRGDPTAVSRRLYTEAGQQAFDEIRRRYRTDPEFRETATRYTQEFERLLAKISQNDRDGSQWRGYLLSNTGKVYTILAHAAGRLG